MPEYFFFPLWVVEGLLQTCIYVILKGGLENWTKKYGGSVFMAFPLILEHRGV